MAVAVAVVAVGLGGGDGSTGSTAQLALHHSTFMGLCIQSLFVAKGFIAASI